jgi:hypothetical protein
MSRFPSQSLRAERGPPFSGSAHGRRWCEVLIGLAYAIRNVEARALSPFFKNSSVYMQLIDNSICNYSHVRLFLGRSHLISSVICPEFGCSDSLSILMKLVGALQILNVRESVFDNTNSSKQLRLDHIMRY